MLIYNQYKITVNQRHTRKPAKTATSKTGENNRR